MFIYLVRLSIIAGAVFHEGKIRIALNVHRRVSGALGNDDGCVNLVNFLHGGLHLGDKRVTWVRDDRSKIADYF